MGFIVTEAPLSTNKGGFLIAMESRNKKGRLRYVTQGRVKWYSAGLGYGFILPDDGGVEVLVHHTALLGEGYKSLENNDKVTYEAIRGTEGLEAKSVSKV